MDNGTAVYQPPANAQSYVDVRGWLSNSRVLFGYSSGLAEDGTRLAVADLDQGTTKDIRALRFSDFTIPSPDGRWVAVGFADTPTAPRDIVLLAADGSGETRVIGHPADDTPVAWTPDGSHLLFRSSRTSSPSLWALPVRDGKVSGQPRLVVNDVAPVETVGMSPAGELYYLKQPGSADILEARLDFPTGRLLQQAAAVAVGAVGNNRNPVYSPDGRKLAYYCQSPQRCGPIVVRELSSGNERSYTVNNLRHPHSFDWAADSRSLLFKARNSEGEAGAYLLSLEDGSVDLLFAPAGRRPFSSFGWLNRDRAVHYETDTFSSMGGAHRIHDLASGQEREILPEGSGAAISLSPDERSFAVLQDNRRDEKVFTISVMDAASGQMTQLAELPRDVRLQTGTAWTPDGKNILFWRSASPEDRNAVDLWILPADGGQPRKTELSVEEMAGSRGVISVHPDGERVTYPAGLPKLEIWKLSNFLDRVTAGN
jgi:Tol biopolymer transport system component